SRQASNSSGPSHNPIRAARTPSAEGFAAAVITGLLSSVPGAKVAMVTADAMRSSQFTFIHVRFPPGVKSASAVRQVFCDGRAAAQPESERPCTDTLHERRCRLRNVWLKKPS